MSTTTLVSQDLYKIGVTARLNVRLTRLQAYKSRWSRSCSKIGVSKSSGTRSLICIVILLLFSVLQTDRLPRFLVDPVVGGSSDTEEWIEIESGCFGSKVDFPGLWGIVEWGVGNGDRGREERVEKRNE